MFNSLLLFFYAAVLHVSAWVLPSQWAPSAPGLAGQWVYDILGDQHSWVTIGLVCILLTIQATILNGIVLEHRLGEEQNLFAGMFYVLFCSTLPGLMHLSPPLMANTFLLVACGQLYKLYKNPSAETAIFNAGFWVGIAALFAPVYLVFLAGVFIGLNTMRGLVFRERLMALTGVLTPFLLVGVWLFWHGRLQDGIQQQFVKGFGWLQFEPEGEFSAWTAGVLGGLAVLVALACATGLLYRKSIQVQKKISLLYWLLLLAVPALLVQPGIQVAHWLIAAIPVGALLGLAFTNLSRRWAETIHILLLAAILILQYKQFFLP